MIRDTGTVMDKKDEKTLEGLIDYCKKNQIRIA